MRRKIPINEVLDLTKQGYTDADIIQYLREEGYNPTQINDAMNQAKIRLELEKTAGMESDTGETEEVYGEEEMVPSIMSQERGEYADEESYPSEERAPVMPTTQAPEAGSEAYPYSYPYAYGATTSTESMEELAEEIIAEKWNEFTKKAGDVIEFKSYMESRLKSMDERFKRLEKSFDKLQSATLERVQEYGRNVKSLGTEIQALEGAFSKIIQPVTSSVKEFRELSEDMQKIKAKLKKIKTQKKKAKPKTTKIKKKTKIRKKKVRKKK